MSKPDPDADASASPSLVATRAAERAPSTEVSGLDQTMAASSPSLEHTQAPPPSLTATAGPVAAMSGGAWAQGGAKAAKVGRYVLLEELGRGAMGVVHAAYDPELDRRIAVKVVIAPSRSESLSEAQSMARLNHPNVVSVYDAGEERGRVFMAMELVDGETLDEWRTRAQPSAREIIEVFQKAAEGLAAAHEAGLVHRDFKPANVMIDRTGRVVVMDFGLAIERRVDPVSGTTGDRRGWAAGTPAYMAPEQFAGEDVTPAADQFAFFVALAEALTGARPFAGESVHELALAVSEGRLADESRLRSLPGWLRRLVLVGLSKGADRRHPSMAHVAREMGHGMARQRRRALAVGGGAVALGLAIVGTVVATAPDIDALACDEAAAELSTVWLPGWRGRARASFEQLGDDGPVLWKRVDTNVSRFTSSWEETHERACVEHFDDRVLSSRAQDLRLGCLAEQRAYLQGLLGDIGGEASPDVLDADALRRVVALTGELPRPEDCGSAESESGVGAGNQEVVGRARIDKMRALGLIRAGSPGARELLEVALASIENEQAPATRSEISHLLAETHYGDGELEQGRAHEREALRWAMASKDARLEADAWLDYVERIVGYHHQLDQASAMLEPVELAVANAPDDPELLARLDALRGIIALRRGRAEEAQVAFQAAVDRDAKLVAPTVRLNHLTRLAAATGVKGDAEEALSLFERSLELARQLYGERHSKVAGAYFNLALTCRQLGDRERERTYLDKAIEASTPGTPTLAKHLVAMAQLEYDQRKYDRSEKLVNQALEIFLDTYGPRHADLTSPRLLRCNLYRRRGDYEAMVSEADELEAVALATTSEDDPKRAIAAMVRGEALAATGDLEGAREAYERGLELRERVLDEGDVRTGYALFSLADLARKTGDSGRARALATRALGLFQAKSGTERWQADTYLLLARVARKKSAVRTNAERARDVYAGLGDAGATGVRAANELLD